MGEPAPTSETKVPTRHSLVFHIALTIGFGLLGLGQLGLLAWAASNPIQPGVGVARAEELTRETLASTIGQARCTNFIRETRERGSILGESSRSYEFTDNLGKKYQVSCDFPFSQGWHELTICYSGAGWEIDQRQAVLKPSNRSNEQWTIVEALLKKPDGLRGYVVWASFDEAGNPVAPPTGPIRDQAWRLLVRRSPYLPMMQTFQVQVFTTGVGQFSEQQKQVTKQLLLEAREQFRNEIVPSNEI